MHRLQPTPLVFSALLLLVLASLRDRRRWWRTLKRLRFLLLALVFVYGWSTPGLRLVAWLWAPTEEGLRSGALQAMRLVGMLASLHCLLAGLGHERIFAGLYTLAAPLALFGAWRERCALRLVLTMDYAEALLAAPQVLRSNWRAWLDGDDGAPVGPVRLTVLPLSGWQRGLCAALLAAIGLILTGVGW
ncbi:hypothetical protein GCM10007350_10330 [Jeongeupia chitinilytica]|uniref:Transmembrane protein n=1 Tax=Jeongeupia chitinilytica TaxID=1041641 RepID=A0ABQ3GWY7_9NEIS|nr:CbiQ family ECF transporter T component [Jeongeupia chitinilytica]GHD59205.1 hypothetical protein GCM10007350_10330 [Jeongeupia chitinilytica]